MTCAKKRVICTIITTSGHQITGENSCIKPQKTCPRLPGEGYAKCWSICQQPGHAEEMALVRMRGLSMKPAIVHLNGIDRVCERCKKALREVGVTEVVIEGKVVTI